VITAFPALVDYHDSVAIELFETRQDALFYHAGGIARLIAIELRQSIKYLQKNLPHIDQSALMYVSIGSRQDLIEDIIMAAIFECFLSAALPEQKIELDALVGDHKAELITTANRMAELVYKILALYREVRDRLKSASLSKAHRDDCREQCEYLVYEGFVRDIPPPQLLRLPVYFQAMLKRIDKTEQDSKQVDRALPLIRDLWQAYLLLEQHAEGTDQLQQLRWMIEEFRISSFAQPMKTRRPVSEHKIRKLIDEIRSGGL
jgi:ATP-dependent helicase HrpA